MALTRSREGSSSVRREGAGGAGAVTTRRSNTALISKIFRNTSRGSCRWRTASRKACLDAFDGGMRRVASSLRVPGAQHSHPLRKSNAPCLTATMNGSVLNAPVGICCDDVRARSTARSTLVLILQQPQVEIHRHEIHRSVTRTGVRRCLKTGWTLLV
jgi:hypothetical protein